MKIYLRLCRSVVRRNPGFTLGLFIMSVLTTAVAFLGANLGESSERSVADYLNGCHMPGALVTTEMMSAETAHALEDVDGVARVYPRMAVDAHIRLEDGRLFSARLFTWDDSCPLTQTVYESTDGGGVETLMVRKFAQAVGIRAGDGIGIESDAGVIKASVGALVSNPETLSCVYDEMSGYEGNEFTYVYLRPQDMCRVTGVDGAADQWLIYFDDGLNEAEEKWTLGSVEALLGGGLITAEYLADSEAIRSIFDDTDTIQALCGFLPMLIWLIGLGFSFVFVRIIIMNQRKMIGLLRALGYGSGRVTMLFAGYSAMIGLVSLTVGIPLGYALLRIGTGAVCSATQIRETAIVILPVRTALMLLAMMMTGVFAAGFCSGMIARMDPAEAYGGAETDLFAPPAFLSRLRIDPFFKLSLTTVMRSLLRQCVGALCISACVVIICVGLEGIYTIGHPIDAVYGRRYGYDVMVRGLCGDAAERIGREVDGVERAESVTMFTAKLLDDTVRVSTVDEDSALIRPENGKGERIFPGDGVIIDEMRAKMNGLNVGDTVMLDDTMLTVTGIAREILYCVQYVSPQTARRMGHGETNCAYLTLAEGADADRVQEEILLIDDGAYFTHLDVQKETVRDGFFGIRLVMGIFAALGFGIGSMLVFNMSVIDFNSNRMRFAILRALGVSPARMVTVPLVENGCRALLGVIIAIPACYLCSDVILNALSSATQQFVFVEYGRCLLLSCLIPCVYVMMSVLFSWRRIGRLRYMDHLNEVE